jgi:hypothetical protein
MMYNTKNMLKVSKSNLAELLDVDKTVCQSRDKLSDIFFFFCPAPREASIFLRFSLLINLPFTSGFS